MVSALSRMSSPSIDWPALAIAKSTRPKRSSVAATAPSTAACVGNVGDEDVRRRAGANGGALAGGFVQRCAIASDQRNVGAEAAQFDRDSASDTTTCTGDQRNFIVEARH